MRAEDNATPRAAYLEYTECHWGDVIRGTKEQLQALGLGVGLAFPGEVGGPRLELRVRDHRGYPVKIAISWHDEGIFAAYLHFPHWPKDPQSNQVWAAFADGVKRREFLWFDEYRGSAEALANAGLARIDQLPGMPGMRKVRVSILPDGSLPIGGRTAALRLRNLPGARWIEKASKSTYNVNIVVTEEERHRRKRADEIAYYAWMRQVDSLPRPARLQPMDQAKWTSLKAAQTIAARDIGFQGMLARIVSGAGRPAA